MRASGDKADYRGAAPLVRGRLLTSVAGSLTLTENSGSAVRTAQLIAQPAMYRRQSKYPLSIARSHIGPITRTCRLTML